MKKATIVVLPILVSIASLLAVGLHAAIAQNVTNTTAGANTVNASVSGNMTGGNISTSNNSISSVKMHLEEGIKALQSGDKGSAMTHLGAAAGYMALTMSKIPQAAIMHFAE